MKPKDNPDEKPIHFEEALTRLETIVKEMESGQLPLDEMMARFEEGSQWVKRCSRTLDGLEKKIDLLIKEGEQFKTEAFEPEPDHER